MIRHNCDMKDKSLSSYILREHAPDETPFISFGKLFNPRVLDFVNTKSCKFLASISFHVISSSSAAVCFRFACLLSCPAHMKSMEIAAFTPATSARQVSHAAVYGKQNMTALYHRFIYNMATLSSWLLRQRVKCEA